MLKAQKGFTLIELVVVIVLLGILGVTALAKFQDLSGDAQTAANAGVAAEFASGTSINFATYTLNPSNGVRVNTTTSCTDLANNVMTNAPSGFSFGGTYDCTAGSGNTDTCSVIGTGSPTGTAKSATVICTD